MLQIYAIPPSLYCAKLRIVLRHKRLEWQELPPPGGYGSEEYKRLVPDGNLPALVHDDFLLGDSEAIAEYLNEVYPEPEMLPGDALNRARIRRLSRFHDTRLEPVVRRLFPHIGKGRQDRTVITGLFGEIEQRLDQIGPLLPAHRNTLTLADCGFPVTCLWIRVLADHFDQTCSIAPGFEAYLKGISDMEAVAIELAHYEPVLSAWMASK